jgi:hypothetical protein
MKTFTPLLVIFLIMMVNGLNAQIIKGKIIDQNNKQAIPFAFIGDEKNHAGTTADIDGNFVLRTDSLNKVLTVQIIGYKKKQIQPIDYANKTFLLIELQPSEISLNEIIVTPNENPANAYIRKLIENKPK